MEPGMMPQAVNFVQGKTDTTYQYYIQASPTWLIPLNFLSTGEK